jgi:hypothetical protein
LLIDCTKVTLYETFEEWIEKISTKDPIGTPKPTPYILGNYKGFSRLLAVGEASELNIYLPAGKDEAFVLGLYPATSEGLKNAISLLSTLDISGKNSCSST